MRKSIFLVAGAAVALTATPAFAQFVDIHALSLSSAASNGGSIAPLGGGFSMTASTAGNASTGGVEAYNGLDGTVFVAGANTWSSSVGSTTTEAWRLGPGFSMSYTFADQDGFGHGHGDVVSP